MGSPALNASVQPRRSSLRRWGFAALVSATVALVAVLTWNLLAANGVDPFEYPVLVLSLVLVVPIVTSFWLAVIGALAERLGRVPAPAPHADVELQTATALVMPIHNEDPARVVAALRATWESLLATGEADTFRLFVLSDTTDPQRWLDEERAIAAMLDVLPHADRVTYRHRTHNTDRKVGNIRDFCRRWGADFECMVVLDADSVMSGATVVHLAKTMQAHPGIGILQVPPVPMNGASTFARAQQFAACAYGRTWASGLAWLQAGDGNYYGHNAILRIRPFVQDCELPRLSGKEPLGGAILSHDFVEAALMRRAGHTIHLLPALDGSYEESPPTLIEHVNRDRRWCQGNLQHSRVLGMPGLRPMSRTHMLMGILSYASAPLWLLLLLSWTGHAVWLHLAPPRYFRAESLFPVFEISIRPQAVLLLVVILSLVFVPRLVAVAVRMADANDRRAFGGGTRLVAGFFVECLLSMLLAPLLMVEHTRAVVAILCGRTTRWIAQQREHSGVDPHVAMRRFGPVALAGIAWAAVLWWASPATLWWMLPALVGMVFAVPLAIATGSRAFGDRVREKGLLLTPSEVAPEPVVTRFLTLLRDSEGASPPHTLSALERLLQDASLRAVHARLHVACADTDELQEHVVEGLVLKCRLHGPRALDDAEQRTLLSAPAAVETLAQESLHTAPARSRRA